MKTSKTTKQSHRKRQRVELHHPCPYKLDQGKIWPADEEIDFPTMIPIAWMTSFN